VEFGRLLERNPEYPTLIRNQEAVRLSNFILINPPFHIVPFWNKRHTKLVWRENRRDELIV